MIITKGQAIKLQTEGRATIEECCTVHEGARFRLVTRHDTQRVDHFEETENEILPAGAA